MVRPFCIKALLKDQLVEDTQVALCVYKTYYFVSFGKMAEHKLKQVPEPDKQYKINYTVNLMLI